MYEELVNALRNCRGAYPDASCATCPYDKHLFCAIDMIRDAADAIEKLEKIIAMQYETIAQLDADLDAAYNH